MKRRLPTFLLGIGVAATLTAADAERGAQLVADQGCLECHTVRAQGAGHEPSGIAGDLGGELMASYTAPALASAIWNHTPAMWARVSARAAGKPQLTDGEWADVFAYLYSLQFFELPGQASHGKAVFEDQGCANCHALQEKGATSGPPVSAWSRTGDAVGMAYDMWTHAAQMEREFLGKETAWKKLSGQDLVDLAVYEHAVQRRSWDVSFTLPEPESGHGAFVEHCGRCHAGALSLGTLGGNATWMDLAAALWNHGPLAVKAEAVPEPEMRKILAYAWQLQYMGPEGNVQSGERVFLDKGCISCHRTPGRQTALRPGGDKVFTPFTIAGLGWAKGREMHREIVEKGMSWPNLSAEEVSNLVAYLNALPR